MNVLVLGAAGMVGRKLVEQVVKDGGRIGDRPSTHMTLFDVVDAEGPGRRALQGRRRSRATSATPGSAEKLDRGPARTSSSTSPPSCPARRRPISTRATGSTSIRPATCSRPSARSAAATSRASSSPPPSRSSAQPFPEDGIYDEFHLTPLTSYGTQKAIGELLLADYSRRGFFDGVGIRLPTICVRPGKPNKAASGFFSGIIREPLNGQEAILPVDDIGAPLARLAARGGRRSCSTPRPWTRRRSASAAASPCRACRSRSASRSRRCAASRATAVAGLIRRQPDPVIQGIVAGWAERCQPERAEQFGFRAEKSFEEIIQVYIDDELGGRVRAEGRALFASPRHDGEKSSRTSVRPDGGEESRRRLDPLPLTRSH